MLREAVSSVDEYEFEIEDQLERQVGTRPLPFPKMDSEWYIAYIYPQCPLMPCLHKLCWSAQCTREGLV